MSTTKHKSSSMSMSNTKPEQMGANASKIHTESSVSIVGGDGSSTSDGETAATKAKKKKSSTSIDISYSSDIFKSLPDNAKTYYQEKNNVNDKDIYYTFTAGEKSNNTLHLIGIYPIFGIRYINENQVVPVLVNGKHRLMRGTGITWVPGWNDKIFEPKNVGTDIMFGPIKLVHVRPGTIRYAVDITSSRPMLLGPGRHYFDNPSIEIYDTVNLSSDGQNKVIPVGDGKTFNFVFIKTGFKGIVNCRNGEMKILDSGLHFIESPDCFNTFVSVQQEHLKFGSYEKHQPVFITADNVELHVDATLFYNITDVKKVFTTSIKDQRDLENTLHTQAMSTLMTIVRSENFSNIGKKRMVSKIQEELESDVADVEVMGDLVNIPHSVNTNQNKIINEIDTADVTSGFQSVIHDAEPRFKQVMQKNFGDRLGFNIQSLRIEKIEFADKKIQQQVSDLAMENTRLAAKEATINAQKKVQLAEADRDASTAMIKARGEAERSILDQKTKNDINRNKVDIDNEIMLKNAQAAADAARLQVEAEVMRVEKLANAEAAAIKSKGDAEVEILKKKADLPLAELRIKTDGQVEALRGVEKVVYMPSNMPLLMPAMPTPATN